MNIWLKLRKTAAIALCELLAIATIFTGCASTDLSGTEGAGHAAGAVVAGEDSSGALGSKDKVDGPQEDLVNNNSYVSLDAIPAYDGKAYVAVNNNEPFFTDSDMTTTAFENYSDLDSLGRCGVAYANICKDIMPTEERGKIGMIKPSGWHTVKYDVIKDRYLYNRCHLIGYQLAGENANPKNLITGTRYLNVEGMLPFENLVADYVNNTGNHVLYRVTPMFSGSNLVANGVLIEAKSVEDNGGGILFNVYCYNVQPGVGINYENLQRYFLLLSCLNLMIHFLLYCLKSRILLPRFQRCSASLHSAVYPSERSAAEWCHPASCHHSHSLFRLRAAHYSNRH